mgnify:CR=1 FL=1
MKRTRTPENSLICVDAAGHVGIVASIDGGGVAQFHRFDEHGNTAGPTPTPVADLVQADQAEIPEERRLPVAQAMELGYLDDPSYTG